MERVDEALRKIPLLNGLSDADLAALAQRVAVRRYRPGATIVAQHEPGETLYLVLSGRVRVMRRGSSSASTAALNELGPGEFFGEMALLEDKPRSADVIAATATRCALLSREAFHECLVANRQVAIALLATLSQRLRSQAELLQRPQVETKAPARERERRILEQGETTMASDIRQALVIKEQNHFTLFDPDGNIPIANTSGLGMYLDDTRHLSGYQLSLGRVQAVVLVSTARLGYASTQQLTNRDIRHSRRTIRKETLLISRERLAHEAGFDEQITVSNFNLFPVELAIQIHFAADFADIFEVRGVGRARRGAHLTPRIDQDSVTLAYQGLDGRTYETQLSFSPTPTSLRPTSMLYHARIAALGSSQLRVQVNARIGGTGQHGRLEAQAPAVATDGRLAQAQRSIEDWLAGATTLKSDNSLFDAMIQRSLQDLRLLVGRFDDQWFFGAGTPWYATLFGRDSLITGLQTLAWNPDLAAGILRLLARYQGTKNDAWRDEEPGKILHELRRGELARTQRVPHTPYYGSIDSTPLFLMLAAAYYEWTGDTRLLHDIRPNLDAALEWCSRWGDLDGDGYIEYARRSARGLANQGWKDSGDGIMFRDGRLPRPPIALVEVQGYVYAAYRGLARLRRALDPDDVDAASELEARAAALKARFNEDFWLPDAEFYALGLDGAKRRIDAVSSNPGHGLWTGIIDPARAHHVADRLLGRELSSGWGIRTLSDRAAAYNPLGYHLGTVWPHDNSLIAAGLRRYGFDAGANQVLSALFDAAVHFPYFRLPELFSGIARTDYGVPVGYPVACSPQAWAAAALPFILAQVLGLRPRHGGRVLEVIRPCLPVWLQRVQLRGLRVGDARIDLRFERADGPDAPVQVMVEGASGQVQVEVRGHRPAETP